VNQDGRYDWYLDLRRFGGCRKGGFGLGVERLVRALTGIGDVRETLTFPRAPGQCLM